jgi:hypothetical protein
MGSKEMKNCLKVLFLIFIFGVLSIESVISAERPWQKISNPKVAEVASNFKSPPAEYSMTFYWGWDGPVTEEVIKRDLDEFKSKGVRAVTLEPGYNMEYLTPGWFDMVKVAVEQASARGMKVWLVDEGKYPSGFAGGKFSKERPDLRMQALVLAERIEVASGETLSRKLSPEAVSVLAMNRTDNTSQAFDISNGEINWTAPEGNWQVLIVEHQFRTSPTRAVNNPTRGKDTSNSLCDYLDPAATRQFIEFTHEQYKKYVGKEFGKTVLGFRGDEPDYSIRGIPWTPKIFVEFERRKGYDVKPYVASFFLQSDLTEEQRKAKADYWDVWSDLFGENFFGVQAKWCAEETIEYLVHLNHEDKMPDLIRSEGDFFRCMRHVQMPGIDAIWSQIWMNKVSDYPKYASSAAHLFGRPRAFTESFAAYKPAPSVEQAKWVLNHQLVRGINMVEIMFVPASSKGLSGMRGWLATEEFPQVARYLNRACYILSQGHPTAAIALYHPTMSMWLGDEEANDSTLEIMQQLLEHQRDFDVVDDRSVGSLLKLEGSDLVNLSGQRYRTVIVPSAIAMSKAAMDKLHSFADKGGSVIFIERTPSMVVEKSFLNASSAPDYSWAKCTQSAKLTSALLQELPEPDVLLEEECPAIKYTHRRWRDAELYMFFNESQEKQSRKATLTGSGQVQVWDPTSGDIELLTGASSENGFVNITLELEPYGTKFIVIGLK